MLQYEFERIECDDGSFGGVGLEAVEHREIIVRRAQEGWRYAGLVPAEQRAGGLLSEIDLIFEKETEN